MITVEQLLTHTSGFPHAPLNIRTVVTREQRLDQFAKWRLNWEPGTRFEYHPTSAHWVLGEVIERVSGIDAPTFVRQRIAEPLGLQVRLGEPPERQGDVNRLVGVGEPPTSAELEEATGIAGLDLSALVGEVTQEALLGFNHPVVLAQGAPGAGGIATAADLALYYQALLHDPKRLWDPAVLADGTGHVRCELPDPIRGMPAHRSLGLMIAGDPPDAQLRGFGYGLSAGTFGHDGAGGQIAWADPDVRFVVRLRHQRSRRDMILRSTPQDRAVEPCSCRGVVARRHAGGSRATTISSGSRPRSNPRCA